MQHLWAPWRSEYITSTRKPKSACVFCEFRQPGDDRERLIVHRSEHALVALNRYPYNTGHLLVMPSAHIGRLEAMDAATFGDLNALLLRAIGALERAVKPQGMNMGANLGRSAGAGIPDHFHYHLVPRWDGDTNFMPVLGQTKVLSADLWQVYDQLKPQFA